MNKKREEGNEWERGGEKKEIELKKGMIKVWKRKRERYSGGWWIKVGLKCWGRFREWKENCLEKIV